MKKLWFGLLMSALMPVLLTAQSAFDGTWKIDLSKNQLPTKPDVYLLQDGMYHSKAVDSEMDIKADGHDHEFSGDSCYHTLSVNVVDEKTVEVTYKRSGRTVGTSKMTVSPDGNTALIEWSESCNAKGDMVSGKRIMTLVAKGPARSHAISGSWRYQCRH